MPPFLVPGALLALVGAALLVIAVLGSRSALRRNHVIGVRTAATMRSAAAFTVAHRVAAVPLGAAGLTAAAGAAVLLAGTAGALGWTVLVMSVLGTLVLAGVGGTAGDRAAAAAAPPAPTASACAGECAGCELIAGCRPAAVDPAAP